MPMASTGSGGARAGRGAFARLSVVAAGAAVASALGPPPSRPELSVRQVVSLQGEPLNENFASKGQALNVWKQGGGKELIVGLVTRYGDMDRRADDTQWAVAWESDGATAVEVNRIKMSCAEVALVVPPRGPYAYEARLDPSPGSLHPECSCRAGQPCAQGVQVQSANGTRMLTSPDSSHFVQLQSEWGEDSWHAAILGRFSTEVRARVAVAPSPHTACPGTHDEPLGTRGVTGKMLDEQNVTDLAGVSGRWCLVRRGGCDETAKVKWCERSGAVGTIVVDHGAFSHIGDQEIVIQYSTADGEAARLPVLFVSKEEGEVLIGAVLAGEAVTVAVGPGIGGATPAPGLTVHTMVPGVPADEGTRAYSDLFETAGWLEVSDLRDIMFVCIPSRSEVHLYDIRDPLEGLPRLGVITQRPCKRDARHDYRILDYKDPTGKFRTILVDPADSGNRMFYYNTEDVRNPALMYEVHADWEATDKGLGNIRPSSGRYQFATWECGGKYCGDSLGDKVYALDTLMPRMPPKEIPLTMMTRGSFARDVACGEGPDGVCLVSLAWDGLTAVEPSESVNQFQVVANYSGPEFRDDFLPYTQPYLKMNSGAQKVLASSLSGRAFYAEHATFSTRHFRLGDRLRAVETRELYAVTLAGYDKTVPLHADLRASSSEDGANMSAIGSPVDDHRGAGEGSIFVGPWLIVALSCLCCCCCASVLVFMRRSANRKKGESQSPPPSPTSSNPDMEDMSVVVGRPVEEGMGAVAQGQALPAGARSTEAPCDSGCAEPPSADKLSV